MLAAVKPTSQLCQGHVVPASQVAIQAVTKVRGSLHVTCHSHPLSLLCCALLIETLYLLAAPPICPLPHVLLHSRDAYFHMKAEGASFWEGTANPSQRLQIQIKMMC